jgi:hypothetical protein
MILRIDELEPRKRQAEATKLVKAITETSLDVRQKAEGWGAAVIPRLAQELKNEMRELKGFSERNIKRMPAFYRDYPDPGAIVPQAVAQLQSPEQVLQLAALSVQSSTAKQPAGGIQLCRNRQTHWHFHLRTHPRPAQRVALRPPHRRGDRGGIDRSGEAKTGAGKQGEEAMTGERKGKRKEMGYGG